MDRPRRSPAVLRITILAALLLGCDPSEQLPNSEELEAQLRDDPDRSGRVGQLVGLAVSQHAHQHASAWSRQPNAACANAPEPGERWIAELMLERKRGESVASSWTETRTLDRGPDAVAMRYAAQYRTEIGTDGSRGAEWRVTPRGTYIATQTDAGDRWFRRDTEEREAERVRAYADGVLQSLVEAAGGWTQTDRGWTLGEKPLRCGVAEPRAAFGARLDAGATPTKATLVVKDRARELHAEWLLSDGSKVVANYTDRVVELPEAVAAPPDELIIPITRDRSLYRAQQLLAKLADDGLATVASAPPMAPSGDDEQRKSK